MTDFKDREQAFEKKFVYDNEFEFKIKARRNRKLGEWVSDILDFDEDESEGYVKMIIEEDFKVPGDSDIIARVLADLKAQGIEKDEDDIQYELERLFNEAKEELLTEMKQGQDKG